MSFLLQEVGLTHSTGHVALAAITLRAQQGENIALIGPSGAGKTTLLNTIGTALLPTAGTMTVLGQQPKASARALRQLRSRIGFVFQYHHLLSAFTALENVLMPMLADAATERQVATGLFVSSDDWLLQVKIDGERRVVICDGAGAVTALARDGEPTGLPAAGRSLSATAPKPPALPGPPSFP